MKMLKSVAYAFCVSVAVTGNSVTARELPPVHLAEHNGVPTCATPERLTTYLRLRNPRLEEKFATIAADYRRHGESLGLRWDYAFFQMIVETGHLTYKRPDGSPGRVSARQNNFAGLGVETRPSGRSFKSVPAGVLAHLQEIAELAEDDATFADVAQAWTEDGPAYAEAIANVARRFYATQCDRDVAAIPAASVEAGAEHASPLLEPQLRAEPALLREGYQKHLHAVRGSEGLGLEATFAIATTPLVPHLETPAGSPFEYPNHGVIGSVDGEPLPRTTDPRPLPEATKASNNDLPPQSKKPVFAAAMMLPAPKPEPPKAAVDSPEDAVRKLVAGRTVLLDTPVGSTIPITFTENGTMRGKAGSLGSYLGAEVDEGKWWVSGARLCQRWRIWFDRETQCLTLRPAGKIVHWSSDKGHSGTARIVSQR